MLRVLGSRKQFCDGISRRDLLSLGAFGSLAAVGPWGPLAATTQPADLTKLGGFGQAKRCILLCLWGSPSQIDTWDPKPDAPVEVRGDLKSIATRIPGVRIGEILPRTAALLDKVCVLRSLTHPYPVHGVAYATTGVPITDIPLESRPRDSRHWPFIGSVVNHLASRGKTGHPAVPGNFALPFPFGSKRGPARSGPFGGFLGPSADPVWSEFRALGTKTLERDSNTPGIPPKMVADPYLGILPDDRFELCKPAEGLTIDRMVPRLSLARQLDGVGNLLDGADIFERQRAMAMALTTSGKLAEALEVQRESPKLRESYGMTLFGQSCLAARRVLEAGGKFATVFWDEYGQVNSGWDTHVFHYPRLRDELGPGFDAAFAALLTDLEQRGMLEETAVVVLSEHGRTPRMQNVRGGGRDHWSGVYSAAFAGGGFAKGRVVGRSDRQGGSPVEVPFSPKDVLATLYHLLGIDPFTEIYDRLGRPLPVGGIGRVRGELLA